VNVNWVRAAISTFDMLYSVIEVVEMRPEQGIVDYSRGDVPLQVRDELKGSR
jgi:hypothetical protein